MENGFDKTRDKEFDKYLVEEEKIYLRFSAFLLIGINTAFIVIDYFRVEEFLKAFAFRLIFVIIFASVLFVPFSRIKGWMRMVILMTAHVLTLLFIFFMDAVSDVPQSFLSNTVIAFGFCSFTITALRFRPALILNSAAVLLFIIHLYGYCNTDFHRTQVPAIISTMILSTVVGYLLERTKRVNFTQKQKITEYSHELEKANQQKTLILSILSHDLASPLNSLSGLISARNQNLISSEEWNMLIARLRQMLGNTSSLLQNLVRWSKTQMTGFIPSYREVQLLELVRESMEPLQEAFAEKNIKVSLSVDTDIRMMTDPDMLEMALRNMISNAVKFSFADSRVDITAQETPKAIEISIHDFGLGMSQEQKENLFMDFSKSRPGTQNEKGTGIGLLLSKSFISMLKGEIEVLSSPGKGTQIKIILPKA